MADILLATLNAQFIHASLGLRYLCANLNDLRDHAEIREFVIDQRPIDIVEHILDSNPRVVGFGIYIWNVTQTTEVVALLKTIRPDIHIVLGGPEVSYEAHEQRIVQLADFIVQGQGDLVFRDLCAKLLQGQAPAAKILQAERPPLDQLQSPYAHYTDADIEKRLIYVEASRGCPFKCEFCLSSLDKTAWPFAIDRFLADMDNLYRRGARHFKFVDRTFNLKIDTGIRILEFFLQRLDEALFLHFELVPDHLPARLREVIARFPPDSLQFEIGIQTFTPAVQSLISRRQDAGKTAANFNWLRTHSQVHIHADLILGLPGEDLAGIARSFNQLIALQPQEIQVGILKRLRGSPIIRHTGEYAMIYSPFPPYNILSTSLLDFTTLQRLTRFARYWDMVGNSGRFARTLPLLLGDDPFQRFLSLSDWLYARTSQTHQIALDRLFDLLHAAGGEALACEPAALRDGLWSDYQSCGLKKRPPFAPPFPPAADPGVTRSKTPPATQ